MPADDDRSRGRRPSSGRSGKPEQRGGRKPPPARGGKPEQRTGGKPDQRTGGKPEQRGGGKPTYERDRSKDRTRSTAGRWRRDDLPEVERTAAQAEYDGPPIPDDITGKELDPHVLAQLKSLPEKLAARVARTVERIPPPRACSSSYEAPPARSENSSTRSPAKHACV